MAQWIGTTESTTTTSTTTVSDIIKSARYDLQDYGGKRWNDDQLLNYVNRIIRLLDGSLISHNSDFTMNHATTTLSTGNNTITPPDYTSYIKNLYIETTLLIKEPLLSIMDRYQHNKESSNTGKPLYWAHNNSNIYLNIEADIDYTLDAYYHIKTSTLALGDALPYNDFFNEGIREAIVLMASKTKDNKIVDVDIYFHKLFENIVMQSVVGRSYVKNTNRLDF